jgi:hypothetical protein
MKLQHHPGDSAHLADGCYFSGPTWFYPHFVADEIVQDPGADQDYRVPRNHQNREPRRKPAVLGIDLAPVADAQSNDAAQQQTLVRDWIENRAERAPLFVAAGDVTIESVAHGSDQKNGDGGETLPFERLAALNALTIINRHGDERRDHQNARNGDLVGSRHRASKINCRAFRRNANARSASATDAICDLIVNKDTAEVPLYIVLRSRVPSLDACQAVALAKAGAGFRRKAKERHMNRCRSDWGNSRV